MPNTSLEILLVDDDASIRRATGKVLKSLGYKNVYLAENGREAFDSLKRRRVDLVLSDMNVPEMSGMELLRSIRNDEDLRDTRFIFISADENPARIEVAFKAGADGYVFKPFEAEELHKTILELFP